MSRIKKLLAGCWHIVKDSGGQSSRRHAIKELVRALDNERRAEIAAIEKVIRYVTNDQVPSYHFERRSADDLVAMQAVEAIPSLKRMLESGPHYYKYIAFYYDSTHGGPEEYADYQWPKVVEETIAALEKIRADYMHNKIGK